MEFYDVIKKRRTIRNFIDKSVEQEKLHRILEAGLKAPTYNHMREWQFILLRDKLLRKSILNLGDAFSCAPDREFLEETLKKISNPHQRKLYSYSVPLQEKILLTAPEIVVVCFRMQTPLLECQTLFHLNDFASVWLVVENILLAMVEEGLYGVTMVPFKTGGLKKLLEIPEDFEIATFIPLGYPNKEPVIKQITVSPKDRIHINKW